MNNPRSFRFEARWCLEPSFEELVRGWWTDSVRSIPDRLEVMGHKMQAWSKRSKREERRKRVWLEDRLNYLYSQDISDDILAEITDVQLGLNLEADKEEIYWEQRARVNWLENGDRNASFFHKMAGLRKVRSRIATLEDDLDFWLLMTCSRLRQVILRSFFLYLRQQTSSKGIGTLLDQTFLGIVLILNGQKEIGDINKTRIVLIPKVDNPKNMAQFRPISLCNVIYKIITKVLVNQMSDILGVCINKAQAMFIPGRLISDNMLIAYEVLHSLKMKKSGRKGNFALKLDISKAYDHVEWDFLAGIMKSLGFHDDWIVLIMRCVCSVSYSVSLNGMCSDWFSPSRGLRQGDPLSPYLLLLYAEGFSTLLEDAKQKGRIRGASVWRERISINHLFFADDCILFGDANQEGVHTVRDIIREYEMSSGQKVNYDKSLIYFGANVKDEIKEDIIGVLGVRTASSPEKYLGLPMMGAEGKLEHLLILRTDFRNGLMDGAYVIYQWGAKRLSDQEIRIRWTTVNQLMQSDLSTWNEELIRTLFDEDTATRILSIPISESSLEDIPRKLAVDTGCPLCKGDVESLDHLLWSYCILRQVWTYFQIPVQIFDESVSPKRCFTRTFDTAEEQQKCIIAPSLWSLWMRRNKLIHEGVKFQLEEVVGFIRGYAQELILTHANLQITVKPHLQDQWQAPETGVFKIIFDASFLSKDRIAITATIARNSTGSIIGAETYLFENITDPFVAEARACEWAVLLVKAMGLRRLAVEGDALSVIKSKKKMGNDCSVIRSITNHIYRMGLSFNQISYRFVPRTANGAAHTLTLEGRRTGYFGEWIHGFSASVESIVRKEAM
ncbi:reverse transcriptase [Gossypium australe]|uniref:Reverse transcriptase n=1 Tax=Gossypium australe TaxID=47621 RepID=A0A5B6WJ50_9ROSI|nr:reverse transcriptase [Gossypium australe]